MHELSLDHLTIAGAAPAELIRIAAALDCHFVSMALRPPARGEGEKRTILNDVGLLKEVADLLRDTGVRIGLAEGFWMLPK